MHISPDLAPFALPTLLSSALTATLSITLLLSPSQALTDLQADGSGHRQRPGLVKCEGVAIQEDDTPRRGQPSQGRSQISTAVVGLKVRVRTKLWVGGPELESAF